MRVSKCVWNLHPEPEAYSKGLEISEPRCIHVKDPRKDGSTLCTEVIVGQVAHRESI